MHPAYSVILFTTASGAGYGLIVLAALAATFGLVPPTRWLGLVVFGLGLGMVTAGLLSSTFHLGRPERAWRAVSQWRTSWLSREGVAAIVTYAPAGLLALIWIVVERLGVIGGLLALATAAAALFTVYCTGMIYAALRTVRQWHQPLVAPIYIVLSLATGAVLLNLLLELFLVETRWSPLLTTLLLVVALVMKLAYWRAIDGEARTYTAGAATGLGHLGKIRTLEPPHTLPNFVMREMGYEIGRKHATRLRIVAIVLGFVVPALLTLVTLSSNPLIGVAAAIPAAVSAAVGVIVERWLFFAEAEHVVMLFYGRERA
ncbi:MAG: dimethyl sulfoxide reductase anchor subunit family protein [Hyphomicrobiaceae bacterium]